MRLQMARGSWGAPLADAGPLVDEGPGMAGRKVSPKEAWQVCPYCRWRTLKLEGVYSTRFLFKGGEHPAMCRHCRGRVMLVRRVVYGLRDTAITMTVRPLTKKAPAKGRGASRRGDRKRKKSAGRS